MKNIYIVDEYISSQKNGIGTFLNELLFCLKGNDCNLNLLAFNANVEEFNITEKDGIKRYLFPVFKNGHFLQHSKIIEKFLRLYIPDSSENIFFLNHSPCADFIESLKTTHPLSKVIFTIHDFGWTNFLMGDIRRYKKIIKTEESPEAKPIVESYKNDKRMYDLADGIICLSKDTYRLLQDVYKVNKSKLFHIPNGHRDIHTDTNQCKDEIKRSLRLNSEGKILLFVGRPTKSKGIYDLIAAMHNVLTHCPQTKLVIVGDGNEVNVKEIIKATSSIASSVIFTGQIDKNELTKWLTIADIGIISSYYEQCSYTGIEMMMFGLPIVASDGFGVRNMFQDGTNARIARIGNRKKSKEFETNLAEAILELLLSEELCKQLSNGARQVYEMRYTSSKMEDGYRELLT